MIGTLLKILIASSRIAKAQKGVRRGITEGALNVAGLVQSDPRPSGRHRIEDRAGIEQG